jgi:hypothetical protein
MRTRQTVVEVDTSPTKLVVVSSLTRDATDRACIFDLIDNSIDAARDAALEKSAADEEAALLDDYTSYKVAVTLSGRELRIEDNCKGIHVNELRKSVLRFGARSEHAHGIGVFGVGLNRALFKLGRVSSISTDDGIQRAELDLDVVDYLKDDNWDLTAAVLPTRGHVGTSIRITELPDDISHDFADEAWVDTLRRELSVRYGRFLARGLHLSVNSAQVPAHEIEIRENSHFGVEHKVYRHGAVMIHVRAGQHPQHRFLGEPGYSRKGNLALTGEFGWTIFCNDRAILLFDRTWKTGWEKKFHTEFNGFVGTVNFVSTSPDALPWNTTKTDVDLNSPIYQRALEDMQSFVVKWRKFSAKRLKQRGQLPFIPPAATPAQPTPSTGGPKSLPVPPPTPQPPPTQKQDHKQYRTVLPNDIDEGKCTDKLLTLVHEAKTIDVATHSYSSLALIRMLFECSVTQFVRRHDLADELVKFAITSRVARGVTIPDPKKVAASLDEMLLFLEKSPEKWAGPKWPHIRHSLAKFKSHQKTLNGVLHNPDQGVDRVFAFQIRTEILSLLRHLIETKSS